MRWSVEALLHAGARTVAVVVAEDRAADVAQALAGLSGWTTAYGGATRAISVQNGLMALDCAIDDPVLVHDAARPFVTKAHVDRLLAALAEVDGAVPALPVADTLKIAAEKIVEKTTPRENLWRIQTPQAFRFGALKAAYEALPADQEPTDDAGVVELAGGRIGLVDGDPRLLKLTYPEDFEMAEALAGGNRTTRIGQGVDAHRWGPGDSVWLCGVEIAHSHTLIGHSDADAGLHAITDAILGAIGEGDIGEHFPPSDPQWKGASSDRFLEHAAKLVAAKGGTIVNVDVTLICERPKIRPHRDAMRARLAEIMGIAVDRVSVKATTTEGMGFTGREEGLLAQAIAAVEMPA